MRQLIELLIITVFISCFKFVCGQGNIGIQLPYFIDNPIDIQKVPDDTIEVRCDYCSSEIATEEMYGTIDGFAIPRFKTKMDLFRYYHRRPIDSLFGIPMVYGSIIAILDTVTLEPEFNLSKNNDSVHCFLLLVWNMGEYFDTNCRHYNASYFPLSTEFENNSDEVLPHTDSVYLYVINEEINTLLEMIKSPEDNIFLFYGLGREKYKGYFLFEQFFTKKKFDITKMYSFSQLKRYYLNNKNRGHTIIEKTNGKTHYYTECD